MRIIADDAVQQAIDHRCSSAAICFSRLVPSKGKAWLGASSFNRDPRDRESADQVGSLETDELEALSAPFELGINIASARRCCRPGRVNSSGSALADCSVVTFAALAAAMVV